MSDYRDAPAIRGPAGADAPAQSALRHSESTRLDDDDDREGLMRDGNEGLRLVGDVIDAWNNPDPIEGTLKTDQSLRALQRWYDSKPADMCAAELGSVTVSTTNHTGDWLYASRQIRAAIVECMTSDNRAELAAATAEAVINLLARTASRYVVQGGTDVAADVMGKPEPDVSGAVKGVDAYSWHCTGELRWRQSLEHRPRLQQKWERPGGAGVDWRDVPTVTE